MDKYSRVRKCLKLSKKKSGNVTSEGISSDDNTNLTKVKFEIYGEEMIDKIVKASGNSGRGYLPPDWVGCHVKVIRVD